MRGSRTTAPTSLRVVRHKLDREQALDLIVPVVIAGHELEEAYKIAVRTGQRDVETPVEHARRMILPHEDRWTLAWVPIEWLNYRQKRTRREHRFSASFDFAGMDPMTAPPGLARLDGAGGHLYVYDGNTRIDAALRRGDETVLMLVPTSDLAKVARLHRGRSARGSMTERDGNPRRKKLPPSMTVGEELTRKQAMDFGRALTRVARRDEAIGVLRDTFGSFRVGTRLVPMAGWGSGGCALFASALKKWYPGFALVGTRNPFWIKGDPNVDHLLVEYDGWFFDDEGAKRFEDMDTAAVLPLKSGKVRGLTSCPIKQVTRLASIFESELGSPQRWGFPRARGRFTERDDNPSPYEYAPMLRPFSAATVPPGFVGTRKDHRYRFGVVQYPKPLPMFELEKYDLVALDPKHPVNLRRAYAQFHQDVLDEFSAADRFVVEGRGGRRAALTWSTRPGVEWQVTYFDGDEPTGHDDVNDFGDATKNLFGYLDPEDRCRRSAALIPVHDSARGNLTERDGNPREELLAW